jgi:hypothetical protein
MLEARITAPGGSLYYASEATPYDLETLRQHLRDLCPERSNDSVTLDLTVDDGPAGPLVADWLLGMIATGVQVRVTRLRQREHAA